ncbi:hypothetical protein VTK26DRAFT_6219 [Humicola hyalothermophila]
MQLSTLVVAALAALTSAKPAVQKRQAECPEVDNIPICGYNCILSAVVEIGCAVDDYSCMCSNFSQLRLAAAPCVYENCGLDGTPEVLAAAEAVCAACA